MCILCRLVDFHKGGVDPMSTLSCRTEGEGLLTKSLGCGELLLWVELELFLVIVFGRRHSMVVAVAVVFFTVVGRSVGIGDCTTSGEGSTLTLCPCIHCCCRMIMCVAHMEMQFQESEKRKRNEVRK